MKGSLRRLGGILGAGLIWGIGFSGLFAWAQAVTGRDMRQILLATLEWAPLGIISATAFALIFGLVQHVPGLRRSPWLRFALGVVLGGLIAPCLFVGLVVVCLLVGPRLIVPLGRIVPPWGWLLTGIVGLVLGAAYGGARAVFGRLDEDFGE
jgi:hypothetical protein